MTHVIWENLKTDFLKLPDTEREWEDIASGFERKANFPHCLGAVDGKHIRIYHLLYILFYYILLYKKLTQYRY